MWTHTVLEIYQDPNVDNWPEGVPADWIGQALVGFCQGEVEDLVSFIPLWRLLWWKIKYGIHRLANPLFYRYLPRDHVPYLDTIP